MKSLSETLLVGGFRATPQLCKHTSARSTNHKGNLMSRQRMFFQRSATAMTVAKDS